MPLALGAILAQHLCYYKLFLAQHLSWGPAPAAGDGDAPPLLRLPMGADDAHLLDHRLVRDAPTPPQPGPPRR